jgi:putative GTP pyrophosphokinase
MAEQPFPYSKKQVNNAGRLLRDAKDRSSELDAALNIVASWRSSHAYPLQASYMLLKMRAVKKCSLATVSQRLKRMPSITIKLARPGNEHMQLSTVQDLGGCRAVVSSIQEVNALVQQYGNVVRDYIAFPKRDGYRSVHLIQTYISKKPKHKHLDGRKTEIQIRTRLQHAWATAVETVDATLGQKLKQGGGDADWRRFFALTSSAIAIREGCPGVPETPDSIDLLLEEFALVAGKLDVVNVLNGLQVGVEGISANWKQQAKPSVYLLILDMKAKKVSARGFSRRAISAANAEYLKVEKESFGDENKQAVLVSVSKVTELKKAFPNFYLDSHLFLQTVNNLLKMADKQANQ